MLNQLFYSFKAAQEKWAYFSLLMVGLMWLIPFVDYRHAYPLTTYYPEWWAAFLSLFALSFLVSNHFWNQPKIPRIVFLPLGLIAILILQMVLSKVAYFEQGLLYLLYLLLAALLMMLGASLRTFLGLEKMATVLAIFLLIGAELNALSGVIQYYSWYTPLNDVVLKMGAAVFGNFGQPNHFANYITLGLLSLGYIFQRYKLKLVFAMPLYLPLLFVLTLSGSRSAWLYLFMISGLAWWLTRRNAQQTKLLKYSLLLLLNFWLMQWIVMLPLFANSEVSIDTMHRLFQDTASGSIRLYTWHEAWVMFTQSPWLGVGFGQFAWQHFQLLPVLRPTNVTGLYNNAHNLVFQLAAETGLAGLLILFTTAGAWLHGMHKNFSLFKRKISIESDKVLDVPGAAHWWGYAVLGVLAIHSMLEYPLWYAHFLAIACLLLGAMDVKSLEIKFPKLGRGALVILLLVGVVALAQLRDSYLKAEDIVRVRKVEGIDNITDAYNRGIEGILALRGTLMEPYTELFMGAFIAINTDNLKLKLEVNDRSMRFIPTKEVVYRQSFLLAQDGQIEAAKKLIEQAIWSYPNSVEEPKMLAQLVRQDPEHFAALQTFAIQKELERWRAVHP